MGEPRPRSTLDAHYADAVGDPGAPTILMVPGIDGTALLFYRQLPLLAERFNVAAFPLPDHPEATMADLVEDLVGLIDDVSDEPVVLCGESFGGALSMSTTLAHPDRVAGLVVINSFARVDQRLQLRLAPWALRAVPWAAMPLVRRVTASQIHSSHTSEEDLAEFHRRMRSVERDGYVQRLRILRHYDLRHRLDEIACPTLFLGADDDRFVDSARWARWMAERVPGAEYRILEGYGHVCLITHDLDLAAHVGPWWERVGG